MKDLLRASELLRMPDSIYWILEDRRRLEQRVLIRQKARAFEGVGGVLEMVDGQEVLRIGDQLYYPEATDGSEPSSSITEGEEFEDAEDEPPVPRPVTSDRFIGSHVIAPVSSFSRFNCPGKRVNLQVLLISVPTMASVLYWRRETRVTFPSDYKRHDSLEKPNTRRMANLIAITHM
jgi:hypothetical protein